MGLRVLLDNYENLLIYKVLLDFRVKVENIVAPNEALKDMSTWSSGEELSSSLTVWRMDLSLKNLCLTWNTNEPSLSRCLYG